MEEQNNRYISRDEINKVFSSLDGAGTVYALKTNNGNELPDRLTEGKDIDLLVLPDDIENIVVKDDTTRKSVRFQKFILTDELVNIILGNN